MSERATWSLLVVLLVAQLVLLTAQVPDHSEFGQQRGSILERFTLRLLAPVSRLVSGGFGAVEQLRSSLRGHRQLLEENRELEEQIARLRRQQTRHFGLEIELRRLEEALQYAAKREQPTVLADVVYVDHTSWLRTCILELRGEGVTVNHPVTSADGLVGRVVLVAGDYAKVQLITDRASGVGAMIERTRRQGIVRGADEGSLEMAYVPLRADVRPGDRVVTAGIDGIYPRGIPVGTVSAVEPGGELFHRIRVVPVVDFGRLDQVYITLREPLPRELMDGVASARP